MKPQHEGQGMSHLEGLQTEAMEAVRSLLQVFFVSRRPDASPGPAAWDGSGDGRYQHLDRPD